MISSSTLSSLITALEEALPEIAKIEPPESAEDLVDTPCGYQINGPIMPLSRYLAVLDDEGLHRLFMLIFDGHQQLAGASKDVKKAFTWLITREDEWASAYGRECQSVLKTQRDAALTSTQPLLCRCSEAVERLAEDDSVALTRRVSIRDFVLKHYGLDERVSLGLIQSVQWPIEIESKHYWLESTC